MITSIYRVLDCGELIQVPSQKQEGGLVYKRSIRLQEFGSTGRQDSADRRSNAILATLMGSSAQCTYLSGDLVCASLRFSIREYQGNWYQDITAVDITKLNSKERAL